jgi:general secretion pathway protein K
MRAPSPKGRGRRDERGIALVIVLLVLSVLLAVVTEFALAMRLEATTTLNFRAAVASSYLAEAGYQRGVAEFLPDAMAHHLDEAGNLIFRHLRTEVVKPPSRQDVALGPGRFSYRITDEESRINLNRATPDQLHRLLIELGIEKDERDVIVDSIQDWRDGDEDHRLNGAESDYYLGLPQPYKSKNADFDSVDELRLVRGITDQIFFGTPERPGLVEYLTVAGSGSININTASDVVLRTLGFAQAEVDLLKQGRPYVDLSTIPGPLRARVGQMVVKSASFRIESSGEVARQGRRTVRAVAERQAGGDGTLRAGMRSWQWLTDETDQK